MNQMGKDVLNSILITSLDVSVRTLTICKKLEIKTLYEFNRFPWYSVLSKSSDLRTSRYLVRLSLKSLNRLLGEIYEETHKEKFLDNLSKRYANYFEGDHPYD